MGSRWVRFLTGSRVSPDMHWVSDISGSQFCSTNPDRKFKMLSEERCSRVWSILKARYGQLLNVLVQKSFTYKYLESIIKLSVMQAKYIKCTFYSMAGPTFARPTFFLREFWNDRSVRQKQTFFAMN